MPSRTITGHQTTAERIFHTSSHRKVPAAPPRDTAVQKHEESDVKKKMLHDIEDLLTLWMEPVDCPAGPTEDLDRMYKELCKNPQILRFLRTLSVLRRFNVYSSLPMEYLGISWLDLRPVTQLKNRLKRPISFRSDEYPFEFLSRPDRAGEFFQEKAQICQETALEILAYVKEILKQHRRPLHALEWNWLDHILISHSTKAIMDEVSALDISLFCVSWTVSERWKLPPRKGEVD
ncbi:hypothetical protein B0H11DRAFT_1934549 [Mycena galericulata]|nr:hypothetical protein B0H11DRAFT_1934549 [Mycena galericulata]